MDHTTPEWRAKWRWPVGTRVEVPTRQGQVLATVTKENSTTVHLIADDGREYCRVPMGLLTRLPVTK